MLEVVRDVADQERVEQLLDKFKNYASGFYYDCTRDGLLEMVRNICTNTVESKDYNKFSTAIANILFKKVYIDGECWRPTMIVGLIDIVLEIIDTTEVSVKFQPASAMIGESKQESILSIKDRTIEQFNRNVEQCEYDEVKEYKIVMS